MGKMFGLLFVSVLMLAVGGSSGVAQASPPDLGAEGYVAERAATCIGKWDVWGTECVNIVGIGKDCGNIHDSFTCLKRNHRFRTNETKKGKWTQDGSKAVMKGNPGDVKKILNKGLAPYGMRVTKVVRFEFRGEVVGDEMQKITQDGLFYLKYQGRKYKVVVTGSYTATRMSSGEQAAQSDLPPALSAVSSVAAKHVLAGGEPVVSLTQGLRSALLKVQ